MTLNDLNQEVIETFIKDCRFDPLKMHLLEGKDTMVRFMVKNLKNKGFDHEHALELAFNSLVVEDPLMRDIYQKL